MRSQSLRLFGPGMELRVGVQKVLADLFVHVPWAAFPLLGVWGSGWCCVGFRKDFYMCVYTRYAR